jgi:hypothetical protein
MIEVSSAAKSSRRTCKARSHRINRIKGLRRPRPIVQESLCYARGARCRRALWRPWAARPAAIFCAWVTTRPVKVRIPSFTATPIPAACMLGPHWSCASTSCLMVRSLMTSLAVDLGAFDHPLPRFPMARWPTAWGGGRTPLTLRHACAAAESGRKEPGCKCDTVPSGSGVML